MNNQLTILERVIKLETEVKSFYTMVDYINSIYGELLKKLQADIESLKAQPDINIS